MAKQVAVSELQRLLEKSLSASLTEEERKTAIMLIVCPKETGGRCRVCGGLAIYDTGLCSGHALDAIIVPRS